MNTLNKITTRSRWSYAWSVLRVVEAGRIPCVSIQLTLSQLTRRKNVSGPQLSPDAQSGTAPRNARTDAAPFAHPVRKFRSSRTGRTSSQWALAPVDLVLARARLVATCWSGPDDDAARSDFSTVRTCRARSIYGTNPDPRPHSTCTILSDISLRSPAARALTGRAVTTFT